MSNFFVKNTRVITAIEFKSCMINISIFGIIIRKFNYQYYSYLIRLFEINVSPKISLYSTTLSYDLIISLKIKSC